ncbi:hypothetical protein [Pedobacter sp. V48]|nr:hypothetical protein [Pedobacter sp. V48]ETZ21413.1 hypothetical protein N824_28500 [Pedobacter sp. V48]
MNIEQLQKQIDFIHEIDKVKYIQRKTAFSIAIVRKMMRNIAGTSL